jgi:protein-S-isoprenylcysteine O-methyltransferase Ste14
MRPNYLQIIALLWLAWLIYWAMAARGAKSASRQESGWSRLSYGIPIWLSLWLMWGGGVPTDFLNARILPATVELPIVALILVIAGLGFAIWARLHLGTNWSAEVSIKDKHQLVVSGPYRFVRHPIYSGILLAVLGTAIAVGRTRAAIALGLAFIGFWLKLSIEEEWMAETFGTAYTDYQIEVAALIPFIL